MRKALLAFILVLSLGTVGFAQDQCDYWVGRHAWYSHQFNVWMGYYQNTGDQFYYDIAQLYWEQMENASEAIRNACGGSGPRY